MSRERIARPVLAVTLIGLAGLVASAHAVDQHEPDAGAAELIVDAIVLAQADATESPRLPADANPNARDDDDDDDDDGCDHDRDGDDDDCDGPACLADLDHDGDADYDDVIEFLIWYNQGDPGADLNNDGTLNFLDAKTLILSLAEGCDNGNDDEDCDDDDDDDHDWHDDDDCDDDDDD